MPFLTGNPKRPQHGLPAALRRGRFEAEADRLARGVLVRPAERREAGASGRLPHSLARRLEAQVPFDFGAVRVHTDASSRLAARRLGAAAYTVGRDIHLAEPARAGASPETQHVLAHEAIHAAQQGALPARWGASGSANLWHSPSGEPQLTPGVDADDSYRDLVTETFIPNDATLTQRGTDARRRFLEAREGGRVINSLWHLARDGVRNPRFNIGVTFRTQLPAQTRGLEASGFFEPDDPAARHYSVHVKDVLPPISGAIRLGGTTGEGVGYAHTDPESDMASTLHHELTHVEFVRSGAGSIWPTGHGDVARGEVEPLFRQRIAAFESDIDAVEARIRAAAAPRPVPTPPGGVDSLREPASSASPQPSGPSFVGVRASADLGGAAQGGARFAGIAGADLVLGRIASLNLGVRGIYLTPDRLLAGGTVGLRVLQTGESRPGERVENPLFFDLEAGVVGQLNGPESSRVVNHAALFGSAGVGQEYGTAGTRVFWRVGGFVVISDKSGGSFAGGTVGAGIRFQ
jgi:Domain of unknown function (DUF4157)